MAEISTEDLQKEQCIFCKIISGQTQSYKVYEDDKVLGVLDIAPASRGHVILIPKEHYPIMPAVPEAVLSHLFRIAKGISQSLMKSLLVNGTNLYVANGAGAGQQIPHFAVHIIPREDKDGIEIFNLPHYQVDEAVLVEIQKALSGNLHLKLQDKLAEQGLLEEAAMSEEDLIRLIQTNTKLRDFLYANSKNLSSALGANPQLKAIFNGKDIGKILKLVKEMKSSEDDFQMEAVSQLLKGKKKAKKPDAKKELLKNIEKESSVPEETPEERQLREKLSLKAVNKKDMHAKSESTGDNEKGAEQEPEPEKPEDAETDESPVENPAEPETEEEADLDAIANLLSGGRK